MERLVPLPDFSNAVIGDRVWNDVIQKWEVIIAIENDDHFPINTDDNSCYTVEGKTFEEDAVPTIYWDRIQRIIPATALSKVPIIPPNDTLVLVYTEDNKPFVRYSKGVVNDEGHLACWHQALQSVDAYSFTYWKNWRVIDAI